MAAPRTFPIDFDLGYDPSQIDPSRSYVVTASIYAPDRRGDRMVFTTRRPVQVLDDSHPQNTLVVNVDQVSDYGNDPTNPNGNGNGNQPDPNDQLAQLIQQYLQRQAKTTELTRYRSMLDQGQSLSDVKSNLIGQPNFYAQCDNDPQQFVTKMFVLLMNRQPEQDELRTWVRKYDDYNGQRIEIARAFMKEYQIN